MVASIRKLLLRDVENRTCGGEVYAAHKITYAKFRYPSRASAFLHEEAISFPANHFNLATTITVIANRSEYTPANSSAGCKPLGEMLSVYNAC